MTDSKGFKTSLTLMNITGLNIFGAVSRCGKMLDNVELLLNEISHNGNGQEEAYHYHSKTMIKKPEIGGSWEWHQDYGYWYSNGCLYPKMLSCMIAVSKHTI